MKDKSTMDDTYHKLAEFRQLTNKLRRYWKRLVRESMKIAKEEKLEIVLSRDFAIPIKKDVIVFNYPDGLEDDNLLKLAKSKFPSLYRRFYEGIEKHEKLQTELREKLNYLENQAAEVP